MGSLDVQKVPLHKWSDRLTCQQTPCWFNNQLAIFHPLTPDFKSYIWLLVHYRWLGKCNKESHSCRRYPLALCGCLKWEKAAYFPLDLSQNEDWTCNILSPPVFGLVLCMGRKRMILISVAVGCSVRFPQLQEVVAVEEMGRRIRNGSCAWGMVEGARPALDSLLCMYIWTAVQLQN